MVTWVKFLVCKPLNGHWYVLCAHFFFHSGFETKQKTKTTSRSVLRKKATHTQSVIISNSNAHTKLIAIGWQGWPGHPLICSHATHPKTLQQRIIKLYDGWVLIINDFCVSAVCVLCASFCKVILVLCTYVRISTTHTIVSDTNQKTLATFCRKVPISFLARTRKKED